MQAAILKVKLEFLPYDNKKGQILAKRYIKSLSGLPLQIIARDAIDDANFHLFVIKTKKRNLLQKFLLHNGIQTEIHYPKIIPEQPFLKSQYNTNNLKTAKKITSEVLSLPCYPDMNFHQVDYVCKKILEFFSQVR